MNRATASTDKAPALSANWGKIVFLIAALLLACMPQFADSYLIGLMTRAFCFALLAIAVDLLWGYAGILSLGQSAFFGIGAYSVGIVFSHYVASWSGALIALTGGTIIAVVVASALGWFIFYSRISLTFPFYVSVVTLAVGVVFYQIVLSGGSLTGASQGLSGFSTIDLSQNGWYWFMLAVLFAFGFACFRIVCSDAAVLLVAIRENEERCRYLGYNTPMLKVGLFAGCAGLAAISGSLYAMYTSIVAPSLVGISLGTDAVIWTALGGRGTIIGPIVGSLLVNIVGPTLNSQFPFLWQLFLGVVFVIVVTAAPSGLLPFLVRPFLRGKSRKTNMVQTHSVALPKAPGLAADASRGDQPALRLENVTKKFGSLNVLRGVNLKATRGELVSIVGPNGAGKTTLIRCIADGAERTSGDIYVDGVEIGTSNPQKIVSLGVGRKFQTANVFDSLTVADCLRLARWKGQMPSLATKSQTLALPDSVRMVIEATDLASHFDERAGSLSHGLRQALELAMVLALEPTVLLLDEPTAGLTKQERTQISQVLSRLQASGELCFILIEHDFDFVKQISSRMVVLHQGEIVMDGSVDDVSSSSLVRSIYLGHAQSEKE